ncbi:MAG: sortase [bacterium]|nr:sortase [bacterium]
MSKKKITIYSLLVFVALLSVLNFRFISTQAKFFSLEKEIAEHPARQELGAYFLPIVIADTGSIPRKSSAPASTNSNLYLNLPSIGISAPIVLETSKDPNVIYKTLERGVVHFAGTPMPGEAGTSIILGHSSAYPWYQGKYGSVFALLNKLSVGDIFQIQTGGKILSYKVTDSLIFSPFSDQDTLAKFEQSDGSSVLLVSCWPVGTNYKRLAVKAELI